MCGAGDRRIGPSRFTGDRRTAGPATTGLVAVALLATGLLVSACGGGGRSGGVATLASSPPPGSAASAGSGAPPGSAASAASAAEAERPQLRLDMSDEEQERLWENYKICLKDHGVKPLDQRGPGPVGSGTGLSLDQSGEPKEAYVACANKLPLQPPELDPDKNPNYPQQWNDYIRCERAHGIMLHVTSPGNATFDDNSPPLPSAEEQRKIDQECRTEVFGAGKK